MKVAVRIAALVALWLLAWGEVSPANVLSGVAVAAALLVAFPLGTRRDDGPGVRLDPVGALRLVAHVTRQLVVSNVVMSVQILRRRPGAHPGVVAHHLDRPSDELLTLMTGIISLSPGTMTVDVAGDSSTVYVHVFDLRDVDAARASLARLERLVAAALPPARPADDGRTAAGPAR